MVLRVLVLCFLCCCAFQCLLSYSLERSKREDVPNNEKNFVIEFYNNCSCVYYYQCDNENFIITNGKGLLNDRFGKDKRKVIKCIGGKYDGQFVCCKHRPGEETRNPVTDISVPPIPTDDYTGHLTSKAPQTAQKRTCGKQLPSINVRIFNDDDDEQYPVNGEFPWLVAIYKKDLYSNRWDFHAGGSLIHPSVIMTANHAVVSAKANTLKVIANGQIKLSEIGTKPLQERNIKEIIRHQDYSSGSLYNDIALLILEEPYNITNTPQINTICLKPTISYENKRCLVAGWGKTPANENSIRILNKVELPTVQHSKCEELLRKAMKRNGFVLHESFMCAGGETDKDACKGDGGSPLVCLQENSNSLFQVGIVAWGIGCGKKDVPGVYVNVAFLHDWIIEELKKRDIQLKIHNY